MTRRVMDIQISDTNSAVVIHPLLPVSAHILCSFVKPLLIISELL